MELVAHRVVRVQAGEKSLQPGLVGATLFGHPVGRLRVGLRVPTWVRYRPAGCPRSTTRDGDSCAVDLGEQLVETGEHPVALEHDVDGCRHVLANQFE